MTRLGLYISPGAALCSDAAFCVFALLAVTRSEGSYSKVCQLNEQCCQHLLLPSVIARE